MKGYSTNYLLPSSALSIDDAEELLVALIDWYLAALSRNDSSLVTRKLASALSTFFIHFSQLWPNCVLHLLVCLASFKGCPPNKVNGDVELSMVAETLGSLQIQPALWVVTNIAEDTAKLDINVAAK